MNRRRVTLTTVSRLCATIFALSYLAGSYAYGEEDPKSVLILVNDNTPPETGTGDIGAGQFVANYYAAARAIPSGNIVHIRTALACCTSDPLAWDSWHISWERFDSDIRKPVQSFLEKSRLKTKIKYIVPTYGVPTHIDSRGGWVNLSVDSFLAAMYSPAADRSPTVNPVHDPDPLSAPDHWSNETTPWPLYAVVRLDGPTALIASSLVDRAKAGEAGIGKGSGVGYFDFRNLDASAAGYYAIDQTVQRGYQLCVAAGMSCSLNDQPQTGGMITSAPNALWAWGWYSGPSVNDVYTFAPGAVGAQMTSYTANSLRTALPGAWVPFWLGKGITATWGATGEPYNFYASGDNLLNRLWNGYSFGEAAYIANPALGWMMVFVGDPLYRPLLFDAPLPDDLLLDYN